MSASKKKDGWLLGFWDGESITPHASYDLETLQMIPKNTTIRISVAQPRSQPRHRLYRVILRAVVKNTHLFATEDSLHKTLLVGCGVVEPLITVEGEIIMIPSSTAFDAMKEEDFKAFFDAAMEIIVTRIIPDLDLDDLLKEAKAASKWKE